MLHSRACRSVCFPHLPPPRWGFELVVPAAASVRKSRINPECDFPNVLERLIRRKHLHEWPSPHVSIEPRERVCGQIACTTRSRECAVNDLDGLTVDEPLGALEILHQFVQF